MLLANLNKQTIVIIAGLALIAAILLIGLRANSFWQQINQSNKSVSFQSIQPGTEITQRSPTELVNLHLFGQPDAVIDSPPEIQEDLPETHLKLVLRGVSQAHSQRNLTSGGTSDASANHIGGALIEGPDRTTEFFRVGSTLPGNVKLHAVYTNRIVIDRNGKLENLSFPEDWAKVSGVTGINSSANKPSPFQQNLRNNTDTGTFDERQGNSIGAENLADRLAIQAQQFEDRVMLGQSESAEEYDSNASEESNAENVKSRLQQLRDLVRQQRNQ